MSESYRHLTTEELVDVLAQKTQKFTQLLGEKNFNDDYKASKEAIQQILAEIELRKETSNTGEHQSPQQTSIS